MCNISGRLINGQPTEGPAALHKLLEKLNNKNVVNWNILITSGKEIKRDSMISVNENRQAN